MRRSGGYRRPEGYRDATSRTLPDRFRAAGLREGATVGEFMAALSNNSLLGVIPSGDVKEFLTGYTKANIQGGDKLEKFTAEVTACYPERFFEESLSPDEDHPTVEDALWLARQAVARLGMRIDGDNGNCN